MHHVAVDYAADGFCRREWIECGCSDKLAARSIEDAENAGLYEDEHGEFKWEVGHSPCRWRPSIHMPRWACRIHLENTATRVERLLDVTEEDARAEGFASRAEFLDFWDSLYSAEGLGRDVNPWVWVVEFKRVEGE